MIITDVPDGEWQIYIKDDVFHKVRGAVRDRKMVVSEAADLKVHHLCKATAMFEVSAFPILLWLTRCGAAPLDACVLFSCIRW